MAKSKEPLVSYFTILSWVTAGAEPPIFMISPFVKSVIVEVLEAAKVTGSIPLLITKVSLPAPPVTVVAIVLANVIVSSFAPPLITALSAR